ncbi:DUF4398 domain-containing protein [Luteibacter jiangsuensis]|uniref:DUF4398 domain-containing protein n=1 Tax=Luteibacter jiangsuensis TaxID=637577 RepID=A0ABX0Q114_9GAMM|nr:DUF4398 domain-containing protein [Luteibacter jiangsuensis]NID04204.1 DUF4398 domain-containing protein [Luteibacter jiangsuensis]
MVHILPPKALSRGRRLLGLASLALAIATLAGCASVPPPDGAMNQALAQLQAARDAGAADYAPVDLDYAQAKFRQAQAAMASRKYEEAALLADESRADSELARAKARLGAARAQNTAKSKENSKMRVDMIDNHANDTVPIPNNVQESETVLPEPVDNTPPPAGGETLPLNNQGGQ